MQPGAQETKCLIELRVIIGTIEISSQTDAFVENSPDVRSRSNNASLLICNVILHSSSVVNGQFDTWVDGATQPPIVLSGIGIVCIVLGVINVIFGTIATQALWSNLELLGARAKSYETKDPHQNANSLGRDVLDSGKINSPG